MSDVEKLVLENECKKLKARNERLQSRMAGTVHSLNIAKDELEKVKFQCQKYEVECRELKSDLDMCREKNEALYVELEDVKNHLRQRNDIYQDDCIRINRLQTTIDTLAKRLAAYVKG